MAVEPFFIGIILSLTMHKEDYRLQKGAHISAPGNLSLMYSLIYGEDHLSHANSSGM